MHKQIGMCKAVMQELLCRYLGAHEGRSHGGRWDTAHALNEQVLADVRIMG